MEIDTETVYISKEAYRRIVIYGDRYASTSMSKREYREVYGVLIGYLDENDNTHIRTAIPVTAGSGAGVQYEAKHYVETAKIDEKLYQKAIEANGKDIKEQGKEFFVGWWHTHPGFGFFFSQTDTMTHLGYQQPNPFAVALIYDCEKRSSIDSGIEVLRLEDVSKNVMSPYIFVEFEIEGDLETIAEIQEHEKEIMPNLRDLHFEIEQLDKEIKRKKFAQLQRNYGLLLVKKTKSELEDDEDYNSEEKYLYEWNEDWIKKKYRLPKFREKIEKAIKKGKKQKKDKKKQKYREKIEKKLQKPREKIANIKEKYYQIKQRAEIYNDYIDTDETAFLSYFGDRIEEYIDILNNLITKAYYIYPDE